MDKFKTQSNLVELSPDYSLQSGGGVMEIPLILS